MQPCARYGLTRSDRLLGPDDPAAEFPPLPVGAGNNAAAAACPSRRGARTHLYRPDILPERAI